MSDEDKRHLRLEIAHVLFLDIVGYSKLRISGQSELLRRLNEVVSGTKEFREAEKEGKLVRLPTGDGMALAFRTNPEAPAQCALEISQALKEQPNIQLRMGIHSGPVNEVTDVNQRANIAGAGINLAQRIMDCGDPGHILLSKHVADDLEQYDQWQPHLYDLGECEVKHGVRVHVFNLYTGELGNSALPVKLELSRKGAAGSTIKHKGLLLAIVLLIAASLLLYFYKRHAAPIVDKSIAVLPLENLSEEKENAFFADGIQDELLSNLAKIRDLKVISRTSVMQYKSGITRNLKEIAQQLGVANVVEGSVRRSGNHIRVSVQLIDALTDRHIWVQDYDRTMADSLVLEGELATEIAAGVGATLSPQEKARVGATPTKNTSAYDAYLRGRALMGGSGFDPHIVDGAIQSFQEAVKLDPKFALAWAYLSRALIGSYWIGLDPTPARLAEAKDALDHAVLLDPSLPETHLATGFYRYYGKLDFVAALAEFQLAEKSLPSNVDVLFAIGLIQRRLGHSEEAIAALRRAVELDPRNVNSASSLALTYMAMRRFSDAVALADHILAIDPTESGAISIKTNSLWAMGDLQSAEGVLRNPGAEVGVRVQAAMNQRRFIEAADIVSKALQSDPPAEEKGELLLGLGLAQQRAGNGAAAREAYQEAAQVFLRRLSQAGPDSFPAADFHSGLGLAYAGLGDAAAAVAEGQRATSIRSSAVDPFEGPGREESMAKIYALLGDADEAIPILQRLAKVFAPTEITPGLLRLDPVWDSIRDDPRFQELCQEKQP